MYTIFLSLLSSTALFSLRNENISFYSELVKLNTIIEFTLFFFFFLLLYNFLWSKRIAILLGLIFTGFAVNYFIISRSFFSIYPLLVEFSILIILLIIYFFERLFFLDFDMLSKCDFWISVGLFIYFTGNFFYLIFSLSKISQADKLNLLLIYCSITIIKNIIISIGLSLPEKPKNPDNFLPFPDELEFNTIQNTHNLG